MYVCASISCENYKNLCFWAFAEIVYNVEDCAACVLLRYSNKLIQGQLYPCTDI